MPILNDKDKTEIRNLLSPLEGNVTLHYFTQDFECPSCRTGHDLYAELVVLSDKLELKVHDFVKEKETADAFGVDKIPALVLEGARPNKIHFYGVPAGYEFVTLLEDLLDVSRDSTDLSRRRWRPCAASRSPCTFRCSSPPPDPSARRRSARRTKWPWPAISSRPTW